MKDEGGRSAVGRGGIVLPQTLTEDQLAPGEMEREGERRRECERGDGEKFVE